MQYLILFGKKGIFTSFSITLLTGEDSGMCFLGSILYLSPGHPTPRGGAQTEAAEAGLSYHSPLRLLELTWCVVSVQDTESQEGTVAIGCKRGVGRGCQVVQVVGS